MPEMHHIQPRSRRSGVPILPLAGVLCLLAPFPGPHLPDAGAASSRPGDAVRALRTDAPIRVDGFLDDPAWRDAPVLSLDYEVMPGENVPAPVRTECRIVYDEQALYVAFRAYDPRPEEIRARLTDRDPQPTDDQVGVTLVPFDDARRGFMFIANPFGVQTDIFRNDLSEEQTEDVTWDAIWASAGRLTDDGYVVEIGIPFAAIRFPRTEEEQTWGFAAYRNYPRSVRHQLSSIPFDRGRNCLLCQFGKLTGIRGIRPGRNLELDPTFTARRHDRRDPLAGGEIGAGPAKGDLGLSVRWAVTPNLSANAAVNPDFSQVEADVQQLDINTRFALFYPERRPFFQEGADFFTTPINAVYTRTVADPLWGLKVSGKEGNHAVGVFVTRDERTNFTIPSNQRTEFAGIEEEVTGAVIRYRQDVGSASAIGMLATLREGRRYHNRLVGLDGWLRLTGSETVRWQALGSQTLYPDPVATEGKFEGFGGMIAYRHESRSWIWGAAYRDFDPGFRADAGYVPRVDLREIEAQVERRFWGTGRSWLTDGGVEIGYARAESHDGLRTDQVARIQPYMNGAWQSYFRPIYQWTEERYAGRIYRLNQGLLRAGARPSRSFNFWGVAAHGDVIDYANARPAIHWWGGPGFAYDFGRHFQLVIDHTFEDVAVEGKRLYLVNLLYGRIVYQLTARTFVRTILQYEGIDLSPRMFTFPVPEGERSLASQLLFSYKLNPQTVFYLGHADRRRGESARRMRLQDRTFFVKIGYAWLL